MQDQDDEFYERADAHIHLSNSQVTEEVGREKVSASMIYATARFNAWVTACEWSSSRELVGAKEGAIEYFLTEYRKMLEKHLDDYIEKFDTYIRPESEAT